MNEIAILQQLRAGVVGGGGGLFQHLSENVAFLMHGFAGGTRLGGVDVNRLAADGAMEFCSCRTGHAVPQQWGLFSFRQIQFSDGHNGFFS